MIQIQSISILMVLALFLHSPQGDTIRSDCAFLQNSDRLENIQCGLLDVPENHEKPEGRKIQIAYVVLKALEANHSAYPLIFFSGGPGSASLTEGALKNWSQDPLRQTRDLILFDQRGINHSSALPNMEMDLYNVMAQDANIEEENRLMKQVVQSYQRKCINLGIELESYNSFQNAQDVGVLMAHLGYEKYNLFGISYGTRLARIVQDMFPHLVHSVILNSPNPLSDDFLISRLDSYQLAMERILSFCESDPSCSQTFPQLQEDYLRAIEALHADPLSVSVDDKIFHVNAQDAVYLIRRALYGNDSRRQVPALIRDLLGREPAGVRDVIRSELNLISHYNSSMWLSVERYETFDPGITPGVVDSIYKTLPLLPEKLGLFTSLYLAGDHWHQSVLPVSERDFKQSDIPTIIFVNQYDPVTPPENGKVMQKQLANSQLFILDQGGHGSGDRSCRFRVMDEFLNNPRLPLDAGCLNLYREK